MWVDSVPKPPTKWEVRSEPLPPSAQQMTPSFKEGPNPTTHLLSFGFDARGEGWRWGQKVSPVIGKRSWFSVLFGWRIHTDCRLEYLHDTIQFKVVSGWEHLQVYLAEANAFLSF